MIFSGQKQVKLFSQEILSKNEEMAAILNMTKISKLDRNKSTLLKLCHFVEGVCSNISAKNRQLSIIENK